MYTYIATESIIVTTVTPLTGRLLKGIADSIDMEGGWWWLVVVVECRRATSASWLNALPAKHVFPSAARALSHGPIEMSASEPHDADYLDVRPSPPT